MSFPDSSSIVSASAETSRFVCSKQHIAVLNDSPHSGCEVLVALGAEDFVPAEDQAVAAGRIIVTDGLDRILNKNQ